MPQGGKGKQATWPGTVRFRGLGFCQFKGGTREQLQNAMLHYFLACKISVDEVGDIILEDEQALFKEEAAINADCPPTYIFKESLSVLAVNLLNLIRGRKNTVPEHGIGPLVTNLARSKGHVILLLESSNLELHEVGQGP